MRSPSNKNPREKELTMDTPQDLVRLGQCLDGLNKLIATLRNGANRGRIHVVFRTLSGDIVYYRDFQGRDGKSEFFIVHKPK